MRAGIRHLVELPGASGPRWFWQPSTKLRAQGWRGRRLAATTLAEAIDAAEALNAELDAWRIEQASGPAKPRYAAGTVAALIVDYKQSDFFTKLAERTRRDYGHYLDRIAEWAGDQPARAITPVAVQAWYRAMAKRVEGRGRNRRVIETPARAAAAVRVLQALLGAGRLLSAGNGGAYVTHNAADKQKLRVERQRDPVLWTRAMLDHMIITADAMGWRSQGTAMLLNFWCGQRQEDVLRMRAWTVEGGSLVLRQGKTGRRVSLPLHLVPELVARLEAERTRAGVASPTHMLLHDNTGQPWRSYTFTHTFAEIREAAAKGRPDLGIPPMPDCAALRWMELRHTAVTEMHRAGQSPLQIASVTGHTPQSAQSIIKRHYLIDTADMSEGAFKARVAKEGGA